MSLAKEALEKGMKEVNKGELKRSPGGLCCIKLAAAKLFSGKSLQHLNLLRLEVWGATVAQAYLEH